MKKGLLHRILAVIGKLFQPKVKELATENPDLAGWDARYKMAVEAGKDARGK